jgi:purine-binding chemotaxis protein CheW
MNLQQSDSNTVTDLTQFVSFSVGNEDYGVHIEQVQEIIRMTEITALPQTDSYVKGIINLRGNIIPIIDMRTKFNMDAMNYSELTRVIVVNMKEKLVGIVVDSVSRVLELPENEIEAPPDIINGLSREYIDGIGKIDDNMIIILKIDEVLSADEIKRISAAAVKKAKKKEKEEIN